MTKIKTKRFYDLKILNYILIILFKIFNIKIYIILKLYNKN